MSKRVLIGLILLPLIGCATTLKLPNDPLQMTVIQREALPIPGSDGRVRIEIGDITGGQVLLAVHSNDKAIVHTRSVEPGDVVSFDVGEDRFYLSVVQLRNFLTGDDFGVFEISTSRPPPTVPDEALSEDSSGGA